MTYSIRETSSSDIPSILDVILRAFGEDEGQEIAELVSALVVDPTAEPVLSLVAEINGRVVGQVLFTQVRVEGDNGTDRATILAPLSMDPAYQRQGLGGALIREGLERSKDAGRDLAFVLGDPGYYKRFGFVPAGTRGFEAPYPVPSEYADAWMVQELRADAISKCGGRVRCADSLMDVKYWLE